MPAAFGKRAGGTTVSTSSATPSLLVSRARETEPSDACEK